MNGGVRIGSVAGNCVEVTRCEMPICRFYANGMCTRGANCRFSHVEQKTTLWECPVEKTGWMIGSKGSTINAIRQESAATIRSDNQGDKTIFFVSGAATSVDFAVKLLDYHLASQAKQPPPVIEPPKNRGKRKREQHGNEESLTRKQRRLKRLCHKRNKGNATKKPGGPPATVTPSCQPLRNSLLQNRNYDDDDDDDDDDRPFGFSAADTEELLAQGVKPWDHDAHAVLAALSGDYY